MFGFTAAHINNPCVEAPNNMSQTHYTHTHTHQRRRRHQDNQTANPQFEALEATGGHFLTQLTLESIEKKFFFAGAQSQEESNQSR